MTPNTQAPTQESSHHTGLSTKVLPIDVNKIGTFSQPGNITGSLPLELWDLEPSLPGEDAERLLSAVSLLQHSSVPVAFPTETVYGLGADATRSSAVKGIFAAKQRPSDNPLIVHIASLHQLRSLLLGSPCSLPRPLSPSTPEPIPEIYLPLIRRFWPGPLTILLPVPDSSPLAPETTAGLKTFGARMPRNLLALALINLADRPIAAPSANASTRPSPTAAEHVLHDLRGRIEVILDGGPCDVGVESTVVDGLCDPPAILRPGGVSLAEIREVPGWERCGIAYEDRALPNAGDGPGPRAPGMKYRHYSPRAMVVLFEAGVPLDEDAVRRAAGEERKVGVVRTRRWKSLSANGAEHTVEADVNGFAERSAESDVKKYDIPRDSPLAEMLREQHLHRAPHVDEYVLAATRDGSQIVVFDTMIGPSTRDVARGLFSSLRDLDRRDVDVILVEGVDEDGDVAAAVMNRLRKAAKEHVA